MGEYAETQGRLRGGDKLRTWKVTRLSGEVRGLGAWAQGVRWEDEIGVRACACCAPLFHTQLVLCVCCLLWTCAHIAFAWCDSVSRAPGARGKLLDFKQLG